jgi:hypothetical protein
MFQVLEKQPDADLATAVGCYQLWFIVNKVLDPGSVFGDSWHLAASRRRIVIVNVNIEFNSSEKGVLSHTGNR